MLLLDAKHHLINRLMVSLGIVDASLVHPREVFREAIRGGAAAIVLTHNHPSGDPTPSARGSAYHPAVDRGRAGDRHPRDGPHRDRPGGRDVDGAVRVDARVRALPVWGRMKLVEIGRQTYGHDGRAINRHAERKYRDENGRLYLLSRCLDGCPPFFEAYRAVHSGVSRAAPAHEGRRAREYGATGGAGRGRCGRSSRNSSPTDGWGRKKETRPESRVSFSTACQSARRLGLYVTFRSRPGACQPQDNWI